MAIYDRLVTDAQDELDPTITDCLKLKFSPVFVVHGCTVELSICKDNLTFLSDGRSFKFNQPIDYTFPTNSPCAGSRFIIPANTVIDYYPENKVANGFFAGVWGYGMALKIDLPMELFSETGSLGTTIVSSTLESVITVGNIELMPKLAEWHIYGNGEQGRFVTRKPENNQTIYYLGGVSQDFAEKKFSRILGFKEYEIKDHLGNVRVAITDYKLPTNPDPTIQPRGERPFAVDEKAVNDYYPFGMLIKERSWSSGDYRYGYNGQEKSLEIDANGNHNTAEFWEYDTRSGRRWNLDPVVYAYLSSYQTYRGNPIYFSDPHGDDVFTDVKEFFFGSKGKEASPIDAGKPAKEGLFNQLGAILKPIRDAVQSGGYANAKIGGKSPTSESIGDLNRFYNRSQDVAKNNKINTKWFAMSAQVTSFLDVGMLDMNLSYLDAVDPTGILLSKETNDFLYRIAYKIKDFNLNLVKEMLKSGTMNGMKAQGYETDIQLLTSEQLIIKNEIKDLGDVAAKRVLSDYNTSFTQIIASREKNDYLVIANRVLDGKIDFGNYEHRLVIGIVGLRLQYNKSTDKTSILNDLNKLLKKK